MSDDGRTPEQRAAVRRQEQRNAAVTKLIGSLRGRSDNTQIGDFAPKANAKRPRS